MNTSVPIWFDAFHVGDVDVGQDGFPSFRYAAKWLQTEAAFPLSVTMRLRTKPYPTQGIMPWLANLLPEEEQLRDFSRALGIDSADVLAVLEQVGGDTAGALSFGKPSIRSEWAYAPLSEIYGTRDAGEALERHIEDLGRRPFLVGEEGVRQSLAGGQKKSALAVLGPQGLPVLRLPQVGDILAVPLRGAPSTLILKPDNPNLPGITENEVWCLKMARAIGIEAARATILSTGKRTAIAALRYDRKTGRNGQLLRVHQEDFAQANCLSPGRKYERGTLRGLSLKSLLETGRHVPAADALALLDQVIFNILAANTDAHAKNYSLLLPLSGTPRLAPLYDVSSVLSWPHATRYYAQRIAGKKRTWNNVSARHWDATARDLGYRPTDLRKRVQEIVDCIVAKKVAVTGAVAALPGATTGYVEQTANAVENNALRIAGRLKSNRKAAQLPGIQFRHARSEPISPRAYRAEDFSEAIRFSKLVSNAMRSRHATR